MKQRTYIAIDLKSFYASVECVDRGLDPLTAKLVVADATRTDKTVCLAVTPALKAHGIAGRARLFEVKQRIEEIYRQKGYRIDFITATPRMKRYMEVSTKIFGIYLNYLSSEDIIAYSIDEIFADITDYLTTYGCSAHELVIRMIRDILSQTGITATAGIGTNLFLAKIAMDIEAKHSPADADGVRIAELDEMSFRRKYWTHRPLTDFWRIGPGIASRLEANRMYTLGDVARCSLQREELLYKLFGVNAELIIDHAWGWEPCTIKDIKKNKPACKSISSAQVLSSPYEFTKARTIVREMSDSLALDLVSRHMLTDQLVLGIGYNSQDIIGHSPYQGLTETDRYGRQRPKGVHGSINLDRQTSSGIAITEAAVKLFDRLASRSLFIRRIYLVANHTIDESKAESQLNLFEQDQLLMDEKEHRRQKAILEIKRKYGKNAILKGVNFEEGATMIERNCQIGGHKA